MYKLSALDGYLGVNSSLSLFYHRRELHEGGTSSE